MPRCVPGCALPGVPARRQGWRDLGEQDRGQNPRVLVLQQHRDGITAHLKAMDELLGLRISRNHDGKISRDEVKDTPFEKQFDRLLALADSNKDGALTLKELKEAPLPGGAKRATAEHYMPDLKNPSSRGTKMEPVFFVNGKRPASGLSDEGRRHALAKYITAANDPWFSRAYINRV